MMSCRSKDEGSLVSKVVLSLAALSLGCSAPSVALVDDGSPGVEGDGKGDVAPLAGACPSGMVRIPALNAADDYCIDSTEVTNRDYQGFAASAPTTSQLPSKCANQTFTPPKALPGSGADHPVLGVNWCHAQAYCTWAGKRLCGRIGGGGEPQDAEWNDPAKSEWHRACTRGGERRYAYGDQHQPGACQEAWRESAAVGSHPECEGGYAGLFDLAGSAWEWTDSCKNSKSNCRVRGGGDMHHTNWLLCGANSDELLDLALPVTFAEWNFGIRCCATPG